LDKKGLINLPSAHWVTRAPGKGADRIKYVNHDASLISKKLCELTPVHIEIVSSKQDTDLFKSYIQQFHYLQYQRSVGESIKYFVYSKHGAVLACFMFGASAWSCRDRDEYIGWNATQRCAGLHFITNNHRFLIPEWVRVPHLASHVLGLISQRISSDWQNKYGHSLLCLETFVESGRFKGTVYKAANWKCVGKTAGMGRNCKTQVGELPIKDIYIYPLVKNFKEELTKQ
jgi:hypothetical protein